MNHGFTASIPIVAKNGRSPSKGTILVLSLQPHPIWNSLQPFISFIRISPQAIQVASHSPKWVTIADCASSMNVATNPPRFPGWSGAKIQEEKNDIWIFSNKNTHLHFKNTVYYIQYTLWKTNLEPENHLFEKENHLPSTSIFGFHVSFQGVRLIETKGVSPLDAKLLVWLYTKCLGVFQFANLTPNMRWRATLPVDYQKDGWAVIK